MAAITGTMALEKSKEEKITRFDVHQMIQHAALMVSFILLVITGMPQKFADQGVSQWWVGVLGGIETARLIHRFAAWVMVGVCVYHIVYLVYTLLILKRPFPVKIIPSLRDAANFFREMLYFVGISKQPPKYDRFNWREKFDYWAIFWGMPVMVLSGFILMFPVFFSNIVPGWIVPSALIAHSDEATLAFAWIFLIHIFFNHFSPGFFPLNTSMFTGKLSREKYRREHPLEYQRLEKAREEEAK